MTSAPHSPVKIVAWGLLVVIIGAVGVLFVRSQMSRSTLPHLGQVQPFGLTNQLGQGVSARDFLGKVWVADIIFSRCAGPCPKMTEEMSKLQAAFPARDPLSFVTLTTDPAYDTSVILKRYGEKFGADPARWSFLTGTKPEIKNLAVDSLKLAAVEKEEADRQNPNDLFIHSTIFVLVDKNGTLRGSYESLEPGFQEKIRADIQSLIREN